MRAGNRPNRVPEHVAVIMDGNGRWAKRRGEERVFGHAHGVESVRATVEAALESGVRYLTLYAFSTENWNRPKDEVDALMDLLVKTLVQEAMELGSKGVRLRAIGDVSSLPQACQAELDRVKEGPEGEVHLDLVLALSYSAKWEMVEAIRAIMKEGIAPEEVLPSTIDKHLQTADLPDPELMIALRASTASATSCCGNWLTQSSTSLRSYGPISEKRISSMPFVTFNIGNADLVRSPKPQRVD